MLLGASILGAVASGTHKTIVAAMDAMSSAGERIKPKGGRVRAYHENKYAVFHRMHADFLRWRRMMGETAR